MDNYEEFFNHISEIVTRFKNLKELTEQEPIKLISHRDADGICSASIAISAFKRENIKFSIATVKQLTKKNMEELKNENYKIYFFTDVGSGSINYIKEILKDKKVFVLDHHIIKKELLKENLGDLYIINPHFFDINGADEISGSGITYLFFKKIIIQYFKFY